MEKLKKLLKLKFENDMTQCRGFVTCRGFERVWERTSQRRYWGSTGY